MQYNKNDLSLLRDQIPLADQVEGSEQLQSTDRHNHEIIAQKTSNKKSVFHPTG